MSRVDVRDRRRDSPERARSFWTVRAAISLARPVERPCCFWLRFTCSYCRARFVPFFTPRGGMPAPPVFSPHLRPYPSDCRENDRPVGVWWIGDGSGGSIPPTNE